MPYQETPPNYFPQPFQNNSINAQGYYVTISDNGVTTIFRKGKNASGREQTVNVGSIAKGGGFTNTGNASREEVQYFATNARKIVTEQAVPVVNRVIGGKAGGGNAKINDILGTKLESVAPPTTDQITSASLEEALEKGKEGIQNISIAANYRKDYENLYYPREIETNRQDRIIFSMLRYAGSSIKPSFETQTQSIEKQFVSNIKGSVTLPIQPGINDSNTVDWSGGNLNAIQAYAASAGLRLIGSDDVTSLSSEVGTILGKIAREITRSDSTTAMRTFFAQEAVGVQNLLSRTSGAILNPNLELLFNGPSLRPFSFTFRLSARDSREAEQIRKIIRFFKQGMSVKTSSSNIFLQSPNIFRIRYNTFDKNNKLIEHPSINRIKRCALLSCDVDYTPDGTYMTYNDDRRTLTSYQLSLRFSELEPVYEDDYGGAGGSGTTETTRGRPLTTDEIGY